MDPDVAGSSPVDRPISIRGSPMSNLQAMILGLIQGLTEFLPISSSTHLKIAKMLLSIQEHHEFVIFELVCHLGTLVASIWYFRKDLLALCSARRDKLLQVALAILPLLPAYFLLKPLRAGESHLPFLGGALILTSTLLFLSESFRFKRAAKISPSRRWQDALCIGAMQATALIPGISRSASTISCARVLGWNREESIRFSFLLAIPTILGGNCLTILHILQNGIPDLPISLSSCLIGFGASCVMGIVVVGRAVRFLSTKGLRPFAWYCLVLGLGLALFSMIS